MFKRVNTKEIESIKKRLQSELKDKDLPFPRKEEVKQLIYYINAWLKWRDNQWYSDKQEHYREVIKSES